MYFWKESSSCIDTVDCISQICVALREDRGHLRIETFALKKSTRVCRTERIRGLAICTVHKRILGRTTGSCCCWLLLAAFGFCWLPFGLFRSLTRVFTQLSQRERKKRKKKTQRVLGELVTRPRTSFGPY